MNLYNQANYNNNEGNPNDNNNNNNNYANNAQYEIDPFIQLLSQIYPLSIPPQQRGLRPDLIESLPTYKYVKGNQENSTDVEDHSCRICLMEYEDDDEIRILPCLHKYHKDCVDQWFNTGRKCPICNMNVSQTMRQ